MPSRLKGSRCRACALQTLIVVILQLIVACCNSYSTAATTPIVIKTAIAALPRWRVELCVVATAVLLSQYCAG
eukprot:3672-Heterococcus_DN1.PRE.1